MVQLYINISWPVRQGIINTMQYDQDIAKSDSKYKYSSFHRNIVMIINTI